MDASLADARLSGDVSPYLTSLLAQWPGVLFRQAPDLRFEFASTPLEELTGVPLGRWQTEPDLIWDVVHEADAADFKKQIERCRKQAEAWISNGGVPEGVRSTFRVRQAQTGKVIYLAEFRRARLDAQGRLLGYEGFWQDITRQALVEKRLASAAWKETLTLLTLGLAHDFNNILTGMLSLSECYLAQINSEHSFFEGLTLIKQNAQHASQLVSRLVRLHHGKTGSPSYHELNAVVAETVDLLSKVIPRRIEVRTEYEGASLPLVVDGVELRQVIINLALNAADAMPEKGRLLFRTSFHPQAPALEHFQGTIPTPPLACLSVIDDGCGIKPQQLASIFEPFFTTKAFSKGTGLGLYNARLFAEKHHGAISVESQEGRGATFRLWLPQADFTELDKAAEAALKRRRTLLLTGQPGRALDDMAELLRQHNYHVVTATRAAEDLFQSDEYQFDGLIMQVQSPQGAPAELLRAARQMDPPLKTVIHIIGCNQDELDTHFLLKADLVLANDAPEADVLEKLRGLFSGV